MINIKFNRFKKKSLIKLQIKLLDSEYLLEEIRYKKLKETVSYIEVYINNYRITCFLKEVRKNLFKNNKKIQTN